MKKKEIFVVIIFLIIISFLIIYFSFFIINKTKDSNNYANNVNENNSGRNRDIGEGIINNEENFAQKTINNIGEFFGGGSGGGSGGNGGSSGTSGGESQIIYINSSNNSQEFICQIPIPYSIENLRVNQVCQEYEGEICINKKVTCSADVTNIDSIVGGNFKIRFNFYESGTIGDNILGYFEKEEYVEPEFTIQFNVEGEFYSSGENGNANKEITCSFISISTPIKNIC